ncbi:hypothetical protein AIOL_004555 [Candidatus Rhodobacter oscarellae]|uniref:Methyltransferase n=1 Tax=Candidatus Rhodobacter oscarellae TaxID=1675527 RepID=A0A0J9H1F3_9RHOB|nr:methyltransferase domain-containing protein [Candidatus Rhodobacter lobularis]KMW59573.1 hypothetical protein AIOL_004555 [Candidatus Rhodobacter lobularis]
MTNHDRNLSEDGYVTSLSYIPGYIRHQAPCLLSFAAAAHCESVPDFRQPFRYIDLGCGAGVTLILLAACYPHAKFVGVDMNPDHIREAERLAKDSGLTNTEFRCASFDECIHDNEDPFDYVTAHGIMSWVSEAVKATLIQAVDKLIAPGGLFYFCHFVRPGGTKMETLFRLIANCANGENSDIVDRTRLALKDVEGFHAEGLPLFRRYPSLAEDIQELKARDPRYLAHEYANQHFSPEYFGQVAERLKHINCEYAGSPSLSRNNPRNLLAEEHVFSLDALDGTQAQIRGSLLSHELFRWDIFQRKPSPDRAGMTLDDFKVAATRYPYVFPRNATLVRRKVSFENEMFRFLVDRICSGHHDVSSLFSDGAARGWSKQELQAVLLDAAGAGLFQPVTCDPHKPVARADTKYKLSSTTSRAIWTRDFEREGGTGHASQVLGGAITVNWFDGLFLHELDGNTPQQAVTALRKKITSMSIHDQKRYGFPNGFEDQAFSEKITKILTRALPTYVKYGIIAPGDSQDA